MRWTKLAELAFLLPYSGLSRLLPSMSQRRGLWGDWGFPPSPAWFGGVPLLWDPGTWETGEVGHWPVTWLPSSRHEWVGERRPGGTMDVYFLCAMKILRVYYANANAHVKQLLHKKYNQRITFNYSKTSREESWYFQRINRFLFYANYKLYSLFTWIYLFYQSPCLVWGISWNGKPNEYKYKWKHTISGHT